jgi:hypothetical protein
MNAINPDPGDDWCNLTVDELQVELVRGLDKIADGLAVLQEGESHAEGHDGMTMTAEQASERMDALEKRVDRVIDVLRRWLDHTEELPEEERTPVPRELPNRPT